MAFCPSCGKEVPAGATFCANCGKPLTTTAASSPLGGMSIGPPAMPAPAGMKYAEIIDRLIAAIIDFVILGVVATIIAIPLSLAIFAGGFGFFVSPFWLIVVLLWLMYFTYFEGTTGQTFGKQVARVKVVDERSGATVDMERAFIRSLLRIVDFFWAFPFIGLILVLLTPNRQRLGDIAAHTVVVRV